jgi:hypothetical protein
MRQDIQKVVNERQRGGSSERGRKTRLKVDPKIFLTKHQYHKSFEDFRETVLKYSQGEPCADVIGGIDYNSYDVGPTYLSSARRRHYGWDCKRKNENTNAVTRFLYKSLGRHWNDIWSEVCANNDSRSYHGHGFRQIFDWKVAQDIIMVDGKPYQTRWCSRHSWKDYPHTGFYVHPDTGLLCVGEERRYERRPDPVTSIHWYGNTWFQLEVFKDRNLECNCRRFKVPEPPEDKNWYNWNKPAVCIHGNEATQRPIWYVVSYTYHDPNEVYRTIHDREGAGYGLKVGEVHHIYYRDVPSILAKPIVERKKVVNRKELALINAYLNGGGVNQPPPDLGKDRRYYSPIARRPLIP